jgi:hypothetical protein
MLQHSYIHKERVSEERGREREKPSSPAILTLSPHLSLPAEPAECPSVILRDEAVDSYVHFIRKIQ